MRNVVVGALVCAGLVFVALGWSGPDVEAHAGSDGETARGHDLITSTLPLDDHRTQLTVIDPQTRVVSVYHIQSETGEIALKSVRCIHWDLQMVEFNSVHPQPREIRALLEQK